MAVGALNTLFSFLVFEGLLAAFGHAPLCLAESYVIGALFNYFSTGRLVFSDHHAPGLLRFSAGYALVLAANLAAQEALRRAGAPPAWSQVGLLPFVALLSYAVNRKLIFRSVRKLSPP